MASATKYGDKDLIEHHDTYVARPPSPSDANPTLTAPSASEERGVAKAANSASAK